MEWQLIAKKLIDVLEYDRSQEWRENDLKKHSTYWKDVAETAIKACADRTKYYTNFVPFDGDKFYHLCADGGIVSKKFNHKDSYHIAMLDLRNCFQSEDKAIEARGAVRELFGRLNITNLNYKSNSSMQHLEEFNLMSGDV